MDFQATSQTKIITFESNTDWTLSKQNEINWLSVSRVNGKAGINAVILEVQENTSSEDRSTTLRITAGTAEKNINVKQSGKETILACADIYEIGNEGGKITVTVNSNVQFTDEIDDSCQSWIHKSHDLRSLNTLIYTIDASEEYGKRQGKITFRSENVQEEVTIYQAGDTILTLSSNELKIGCKGGETEIVVKSNFDFGIDLPVVDWLTQNTPTTRAVTTHTIKILVSENPTHEKRSVSIRIYDKKSELADTVTITQDASEYPLYFAEKDVTLLEGESSSLQVTNSTGDAILSFISADPSVAIVDDKGTVTAKKKGTTTLTVSTPDNKYSDQCVITVKDISDYITAYCSSFSGMSNSGLILYGSQYSWRFINNSPKQVTLSSLQLVDGVTNEKTQEMTINEMVGAGESTAYKTTIGLRGIHSPVTCIFKFTCEGKTYTKEAICK